jgi:UDP-N-acetylglucosamine transferase subunit ALG13
MIEPAAATVVVSGAGDGALLKKFKQNSQLHLKEAGASKLAVEKW